MSRMPLPSLWAGAPRYVWSFERACGGVRNTLASESARGGKRTKLARVTLGNHKKNHRKKKVVEE